MLIYIFLFVIILISIRLNQLSISTSAPGSDGRSERWLYTFLYFALGPLFFAFNLPIIQIILGDPFWLIHYLFKPQCLPVCQKGIIFLAYNFPMVQYWTLNTPPFWIAYTIFISNNVRLSYLKLISFLYVHHHYKPKPPFFCFVTGLDGLNFSIICVTLSFTLSCHTASL